MAARSSKGKKPARKSASAGSRSAKKAKRPAAKSRGAAESREEAADVVYSDIRRSMHGAILRHLR